MITFTPDFTIKTKISRTKTVPIFFQIYSKSIRPKSIISKLDAKNLKAKIIYQDDDIIIINKPSGLAVQGGSRLNSNLDDMLKALYFEKNEKPRLVHRLDKDTSGVLLIARHAPAARALAKSFQSKEIRKIYWAIVVGVPSKERGLIDLKLTKKIGVGGEKVIASVKNGKTSQTIFRIVDFAGDQAAWLVFEPLTGRKHQLRAHAVTLGTPILGDGKYGQRKAFLKNDQIATRLHLHARGMKFIHPAGHKMEILAPVPDYITQTFKVLGFDLNKEKDPFMEPVV